jgi:flagellar basal body-associated protein FliL
MQTLKSKFVKGVLILGLFLFFVSAPALTWAVDASSGGGGGSGSGGSGGGETHPCHPEQDSPPGQALSPSEVASCQACSQKNPTPAELSNCLKKNPIVNDLNIAVNFLSAGAGIIIIGSIIVAGIQYSFAGSNANEVSAAKNRIRDALIALFAFFFIWGFLQWLIPGGVLFK